MATLKDVTVVVVHGAWGDGSTWAPVIRELEQQGAKVVAASLPLSSFGEDAAALKRTIARTTGPVIVAGHAYAGAVIGTAHDERVKALVYVAALVPDEGETVFEAFTREKPHPDAPPLAPDEDGYLWLPDSAFENAFSQNSTSEQKALSRAVQRPIALKTIQEPMTNPAWRTKPSWYLLAEEDRMIDPKAQRFMAERAKAKVMSAAVDHAPQLTAPEKVVEIIREAAEAV